MTLRALAALLGATAILSLAAAPGSAAPAQTTAIHHPHRVASVDHARQQVQMRDKTSTPGTSVTEPGTTATAPGTSALPNHNVIVSVGPQAMAVQRIRDLAMEETG